MDYNSLNNAEKKSLLEKEYIKKQKSMSNIAERYNTYPNRLLRDARKFNLKIRSRSTTQKILLESGAVTHPTQGKPRSQEEKEKIGAGIASAYENSSDKVKQERSDVAKKLWDKRSESDIENMRISAIAGMKKAAIEGSKVEKFIRDRLIELGYEIEFHSTHLINDNKMHIDIYVKDPLVAIEIDGPTHHTKVWDDEILKKNRAVDRKKNGLLIQQGISVLRVKYSKKNYSATHNIAICNKIEEKLEKIKELSEATLISIETKNL